MQNKPSYSYRFNLGVQNDESKIGLCEGKTPPNCSLVTGMAGTGKSWQVKELIRKEPRKHILAATTGIAAINLGEEAKTIHSILKFFNADSCRRNYTNGNLQWNLSRLLNSGIEVLHIDECSMLSSPILDDIVEAIAEVNNSSVSARQLSLELIGDFCQLPSVPDKYSSNPRAKVGEFAFKANAWRFFEDNITKLTKIWRQDNLEFVNALNALRSANAVEAVRLLQNCGVRFTDNLDEDFEGTTLIAKNDAVDAYNLQRLNKIQKKLLRSLAIKKGKQLKEWEDNIPFEFRTKETAYVMILKNDTINWDYVNGDCGEIVDFDIKEDEFKVKLVRTNKIVSISKVTRLNIIDTQPSEKDIAGNYKPRIDFNTGKHIIGEISYHPLRAAYASTIHKCAKEDTYVFTEGGLKYIKDLEVGERIYNGREYQTILAKENTDRPALKITTYLGYEIICSPEHKFPIKYFLKEAKDLTTKDKFYLSKNENDSFDYLMDDDLAWLLGILVGDGSYTLDTGRVDVCSQDKDIQDEVERIITSYGLNYKRRNDKRKDGYIYSKAFRELLLKEFDLTRDLAPKKKIPRKILTAQRSAKAAFLAGLFDSDGCVRVNSIVFTTSSEVLGKEVQLLLLDLRMVSRRVKIRTTYKSEIRYYWQVLIPQFYHARFTELVRLRLGRKQESLNTIVKANRIIERAYVDLEDKIVSIELLEDKIPMVDIEVSGDNLFVANGILTHNSQGLSLDRVQISTSHSFFGFPSMAYVSISRCRTPEGLTIVGTPKDLESKIKTAKEVLQWI